MEKKMQRTIIKDRPYRLHNIYMHYVWKIYTWAYRLLLFTYARLYASNAGAEAIWLIKQRISPSIAFIALRRR